MHQLEILFVMLVLYLGASAWAYRDIGIARRQQTEEHTHTARSAHRKKTHARIWQWMISIVSLCVGVLLITAGLGLMVRGVFGASGWTVLTIAEGYPVNDVITGLALALLGALVVHETRYTIIKHPRPPHRFRGRTI